MIDCTSWTIGNIVYGVTKANAGKFTPLGFSISPTDGISDTEVLMCRNALSAELGFEKARTHWQRQVHGKALQHIPDNADNTAQTDGMICNEAGRLLCVSIADCCAVLLWNEEQTMIAALHSGWRGTQQNIVADGIRLIVEKYHLPATELRAWLSPCASGEKYEVRSDVQQYFPTYCRDIGEGRYLFDNKRAIAEQLMAEGVAKENIRISPICTITDTDYHSYRRDGVHSGRMAAFIGIRDSNPTV